MLRILVFNIKIVPMRKSFLSMMALAFCVSSFAGVRVVDFVFAEHEHSCEVQTPLYDGQPDEERIAADLVGVKFSETTRDGFFKDEKLYFAKNEKLTVSITNVEHISNDEIKYKVFIDLLTPTRGHYIINGEVRYYNNGNDWVFDMFLCYSIMPYVTNNYNDCISIENIQKLGRQGLRFINHSNVKLAVYLTVKETCKKEPYNDRIIVWPNDTYMVDFVEEYTVHYIERY